MNLEFDMIAKYVRTSSRRTVRPAVILYRKARPLRVRALRRAGAAVLVRDHDRSVRRAPRDAGRHRLPRPARHRRADKLEVSVCDDARDELERARARIGPLLIEASRNRGGDLPPRQAALELCEEQHLVDDASRLDARRAAARAYDAPSIVIAAWPLELARLEELFADAQQRGLRWGVAVPLLFPSRPSSRRSTALADLAQ